MDLTQPQRASDFLPPQMLHTLKQQQQKKKEPSGLGQLTSPGRFPKSPKKENEVSFFYAIPLSEFLPLLHMIVWVAVSPTSCQPLELPQTEVKVHPPHQPPTVCVWSGQQVS